MSQIKENASRIIGTSFSEDTYCASNSLLIKELRGATAHLSINNDKIQDGVRV